MPNRVVREAILESEKVNKLTWGGEVFYRRLMSIADDFGRCDGRTVILRSRLYPLRIDKVSEPDIVKWISECEEAGLVRSYLVDEKPYLKILNFGQTVRTKKAKYPPPPQDGESCKQMQADVGRVCSACMPETKRNELETETDSDAFFVGGTIPDDNYPNGEAMFEDVKTNEQLVEQLTRIVWNEGYRSVKESHVMLGVKKFVLIESAKDEFKHRTRAELKNHLINWITKQAPRIADYAAS